MKYSDTLDTIAFHVQSEILKEENDLSCHSCDQDIDITTPFILFCNPGDARVSAMHRECFLKDVIRSRAAVGKRTYVIDPHPSR